MLLFMMKQLGKKKKRLVQINYNPLDTTSSKHLLKRTQEGFSFKKVQIISSNLDSTPLLYYPLGYKQAVEEVCSVTWLICNP